MSNELLEQLINEYAVVYSEWDAVWDKYVRLLLEMSLEEFSLTYPIPQDQRVLIDRQQELQRQKRSLRYQMAKLLADGEEYSSRAGHRVRKDADGQVDVQLAEVRRS